MLKTTVLMATVLMATVLMATVLMATVCLWLDNCGKVSLIDLSGLGNRRVTLVNNDDSIAIDTPLLGKLQLCCEEPFYREHSGWKG